MDMIALPDWSPELVAERNGRSGRGAEISHELEDLFCAVAGIHARRSWWINHSNNRDLIMTKIREVVVVSDPTHHGALVGHVGESQFPVGGPDGVGHISSGPNPYDLLSASLAACTAMSVRLQARRQKLPLERLEVGVSFHHGAQGERDSFARTLVLGGELDAQQRTFLLEAANLCPVGKILGIGADINTRLDATTSGHSPSTQASYEDDLTQLPIPNITPD
jgi:putative redox protein